ncbi:hypothetical protein HOG21_08345 [bacterium]|nr:hypothetical protein [bacterium]
MIKKNIPVDGEHKFHSYENIFGLNSGLFINTAVPSFHCVNTNNHAFSAFFS